MLPLFVWKSTTKQISLRNAFFFFVCWFDAWLFCLFASEQNSGPERFSVDKTWPRFCSPLGLASLLLPIPLKLFHLLTSAKRLTQIRSYAQVLGNRTWTYLSRSFHSTHSTSSSTQSSHRHYINLKKTSKLSAPTWSVVSFLPIYVLLETDLHTRTCNSVSVTQQPCNLKSVVYIAFSLLRFSWLCNDSSDFHFMGCLWKSVW